MSCYLILYGAGWTAAGLGFREQIIFNLVEFNGCSETKCLPEFYQQTNL